MGPTFSTWETGPDNRPLPSLSARRRDNSGSGGPPAKSIDAPNVFESMHLASKGMHFVLKGMSRASLGMRLRADRSPAEAQGMF